MRGPVQRALGQSCRHGINLGAPLVVNGAATGTFVVDAKDRVGPDYGECGMQPPRFSFE